MSSQLPPRPEGRNSGFPYSILWEEFAQICEELGQQGNPEKLYEALLPKAAPLAVAFDREPSRMAIRETIQPLELSEAAAEQLTRELYRIAAAYRIPQLKKALGLGASATKSHLTKMAAAAAKLSNLLENTPLEQEVVLGLLRGHIDPDIKVPLFDFKDLVNEISKLAAAATLMADEIPQMPRGTSANILQARLIEAATQVIGESAADYLEVLQANTEGRNPRPKSTSARVLFAYLKLVEPAFTNATIVRLFSGHNYGPKEITMKQLESLPPESWPHHVARKKLTR
jgi:hypothetical protein